MNENYALKHVPSTEVSAHNSPSPLENGKSSVSRDEADMARFGKRQQLRRNFGLISIIGLTCTLMITWEGILIIFQGEFINGGPTGLVGGYILAWIGNLSQVLVMSELGSMIPLAGGEYNWVAILAPRSMSKFLSYLTGWITVIAWQAATGSAVLLCGQMIQGLAVLNFPDYVPQRWQATLIFYAVITLTLFVNTYLARILPKIEALILVIHIVGFFGILIPLVYLAPKGNTSDVFNSFFNLGEWQTKGLSFFVGAVTTMFAFIGIDGATHMAEEIENAAVVIPRSMIVTVFINGGLGFAMLIATLFCLGDPDAALASPTGYPFMQIFLGATNSTRGATAMISVIVATMIFATFGVLATASRMLWAFARERALPGSKYISRVERTTALPLWAIGVTVVVNLLLALVNIGSVVAFNALTGLTVAAFYSSFIIAASVSLRKRLSGEHMQWGPFKLGIFGVPVTLFAIAYSLIGAFFSFWPPFRTFAVTTMNWSVTVFVGVLALAMVYWAVRARHVYTGPIVEISEDERRVRSETTDS